MPLIARSFKQPLKLSETETGTVGGVDTPPISSVPCSSLSNCALNSPGTVWVTVVPSTLKESVSKLVLNVTECQYSSFSSLWEDKKVMKELLVRPFLKSTLMCVWNKLIYSSSAWKKNNKTTIKNTYNHKETDQWIGGNVHKYSCYLASVERERDTSNELHVTVTRKHCHARPHEPITSCYLQ